MDLFIGFMIGVMVSGVIRICIGRFIIYTPSLGWVWKWSRFDEEEQRIRDQVNEALDIGVRSEQTRQNILRLEASRRP